MTDYIAWLGYEGESGMSVKRGTLAQVENEARRIAATKNWQEWANGRKTVLRVTRGARQMFVKSIILD